MKVDNKKWLEEINRPIRPDVYATPEQIKHHEKIMKLLGDLRILLKPDKKL